MCSAVIDSNSFSQVKVSALCLIPLAESDYKLMTLVCASSWLTYCHMTGVEVTLWVFGGRKYDSSSVTKFLRTTACVIVSVHHFISWGPIIMKAFGMCDA